MNKLTDETRDKNNEEKQGLQLISPGKIIAFEKTFEELSPHLHLFKNAVVLEFGCDGFLFSAKKIKSMGAQKVIATNLKIEHIAKRIGLGIDRIDKVNVSDGIELMARDATKTGFDPGSFDIVFGRALLEHITDLSMMLSETYRVLKPGGFFYFDGGPLWMCGHGHHLWMQSSTGTRYNFVENNPIKPYEHLLFDAAGLADALGSRGVNEKDASEISEYVYHGKSQNRLRVSEIDELFRKSKLVYHLKKFTSNKVIPDEVRAKYPGDELSVSRISVHGFKP